MSEKNNFAIWDQKEKELTMYYMLQGRGKRHHLNGFDGAVVEELDGTKNEFLINLDKVLFIEKKQTGAYSEPIWKLYFDEQNHGYVCVYRKDYENIKALLMLETKEVEKAAK